MFQAHGICKSYHRRPVLRDIGFCLPSGHCLGVTGENGSGKTTLLSILAQTLTPDAGNITYHGQSVLGDRQFLRRQLGYVPQSGDLLPELTGRETLALWSRACGGEEPLPRQIAELLGIGELLPVRAGEMSGGMAKRLSIAMALSTGPEILIMDEATSGLDKRYREALLCYLQEDFLKKGGRMVWCSHHPEELSRLCGSILPLGE